MYPSWYLNSLLTLTSHAIIMKKKPASGHIFGMESRYSFKSRKGYIFFVSMIFKMSNLPTYSMSTLSAITNITFKYFLQLDRVPHLHNWWTEPPDLCETRQPALGCQVPGKIASPGMPGSR
jgi:hypothetical protein